MTLDLEMPVMGGLEFLHELQHIPNKPNAPVIMITGLLNTDIREKATTLGTYTIVGKPFDLGELRALVAQLCMVQTLSLKGKSLLPK